ncbi:hypothetical protein CNY67_05470 [Desulfovibrio sp. G11]|nr:hypothetical protein CNY67_05470 [Desulfovibrio sp. G11]
MPLFARSGRAGLKPLCPVSIRRQAGHAATKKHTCFPRLPPQKGLFRQTEEAFLGKAGFSGAG